jgi:membrane fusion protein (multidrug efflux system)
MPKTTEADVQALHEEKPAPPKPKQDDKPAEYQAVQKPPDEKPEKPPLRKRISHYIHVHPIRMLIFLIILVALAIAGWFWWQYLESYDSTDDAFIDGHVNAITPRISGVITGVYVEENQAVKKGALLIELDPSDYKVSLERAQANLAQARAGIVAQETSVPITTTSTATTIETARSEVANAQAALAGAQREHEVQAARLAESEANNANAQADLARYRMLVAKDEVSREEFDRREANAAASAATVRAQQAAVAAAQKAIDQRNAALSQARARLNESISTAPQQVTARRAGVDVRRAQAQAALAAVDQARLNLEYTKIYAPVDGIVGKRSAELGQRVQPGQQLLAIVQTDDVWVTANFKENELRRMRAGDAATIHVDSFDRDYNGYVESMPAASSATFSVLPPENATGNYVKVVQRLPVRIRLKPGQDPQHILRPGMSAEPKVWLR